MTYEHMKYQPSLRLLALLIETNTKWIFSSSANSFSSGHIDIEILRNIPSFCFINSSCNVILNELKNPISLTSSIFNLKSLLPFNGTPSVENYLLYQDFLSRFNYLVSISRKKYTDPVVPEGCS